MARRRTKFNWPAVILGAVGVALLMEYSRRLHLGPLQIQELVDLQPAEVAQQPNRQLRPAEQQPAQQPQPAEQQAQQQPRQQPQATSGQPKLSADNGSEVYYHGVYWNDFETVRRHINKMATGDENLDWKKHLLQWNGGKPFRKALMISCGNGWVERDLKLHGVLEDAVGIDVSEVLLQAARDEAKKDGLPFRYYKLDSNKEADFPEGSYDLVVNHAALHHVAFLDFHLRALARMLAASKGTLVNFDYSGPHRNQYDLKDFEATRALSESLPPELRHPKLQYPHLPTMLATDPSEAIHSELIQSHLERYFDPAWKRHLGGGLAYLVLTHNHNLKSASEATLNHHLTHVVKKDEDYTLAHPSSSLFFYSIERPKTAPIDESLLRQWEAAERQREAAAAEHKGNYYPQSEGSVAAYGKFDQQS